MKADSVPASHHGLLRMKLASPEPYLQLAGDLLGCRERLDPGLSLRGEQGPSKAS